MACQCAVIVGRSLLGWTMCLYRRFRACVSVRLLEAKVCRTRKGASGEADAVKISEVLPFLEYDIQRQITLKLKVLGLNAAFGLTCQIQLSGDIIVATAQCTAVLVTSLPAPPLLVINR